MLLALAVVPRADDAVTRGLRQASDTTLTFDNLTVGTRVTNQYDGITFGSARTYGFAAGTPGDGVVSPNACGTPDVEAVGGQATTESPPNAASLSCDVPEFTPFGTFAVLTDFANHVGAFVGDPSQGANATSRFELDVYDINRHLLAATTATTPASSKDITTQIGVTTSGYDIAYFALYEVTPSVTDHTSTGVDDLDFNPCTPGVTCDPQISLSTSAGGQLAQGASAQYVVSLIRHNGSNGPVQLSTPPLGSFPFIAATATFTPNPIQGTGTSGRVILDVRPTARLGPYDATITATPLSTAAGTRVQSVPATLTVVPPFNVYAGGKLTTPSTASLSVPPCSTASTAVTTLLGPGFIGSPVDLTLSSTGDSSDFSWLPLPKTSLNNPADFDVSGQNEQLLTVTRNANDSPATPQLQVSGRSGPFTEPTAVINLVRGEPQVTSVQPVSVLAPQRLQPGSEVTIRGHGFCPGSTVAFGNAVASVPADSLRADGTELHARVSQLATDGPVTVTSAGQSGASTTNLSVDSYRNVNGYQFKNRAPHVTFGQLTDAFGRDQTYDSIDFCFPFGCRVYVRDPFAMILNGIANAAFSGSGGGDCFGFSLSSQRFLEGDRSVREFPHGKAGTIYSLDGLPDPSGPLLEYLNAMQVSQLSTEFLGHYLSEAYNHTVFGGALAANAVNLQLRSILQAGRFPLIALRDGGSGHVVIAYGIQGGPPDWWVDVYDSNLPFAAAENTNGGMHAGNFASSRIHIDSDGNWTLVSSNMSGDMQGFVVTDPALLPLHPTMVATKILHDFGGILFGSAGPPDTTGARPASSPPSAITQVSDGAGHTLYDASGQPNTDAKTALHAAPFAPLVGASGRAGVASAARAVLLPSSATMLKATVSGRGAGEDTHTFVGGRFAAQVDTRAQGGAKDTLTFTADSASLSTEAGEKPLGLTLVRAASGIRYAAEVRTMTFKGAGDSLSLGNANGGFDFVHHGAGTQFSFTLSALGPRSEPEVFSSGPLPIGAGADARISRIRWGALANSPVTVIVGGRTLIVRNRFRSSRAVSIASVQVKRLANHRATLRVNARFARLPAGAQLAFAWLVRKGGRTIATHAALATRGSRWATFSFKAKRHGSYTLTATATIVTIHGVSESTSHAVRVVRFRL